MSLMAPHSSRHRRSISSVLSRNRYDPMPPIALTEEDEQFQRQRRRVEEEKQFQRERRRELQFTLDKLEGRIRVNMDGRFERIEPKDPAPNDMCSLMSMLGDTRSNADNSTAEDSDLDDHSDYGMPTGWAGGRVKKSNPGYGDSDYGGPSYSDNYESGGVKSMVTGGVTTGSSSNITHPGFSWPQDSEERWETSSRVSEDSLFDEHTRHPPEPKTSGTRKAIERFRYFHSPSTRYFPLLISYTISPLSAATISPYQDYLRTKILPKLPTDNSSIDQVGEYSYNNEPRALSYISPFDPHSTTLTQARIVFQGKPSLMKKIIGIVAHPMKRLTSRNKKSPVNIGNECSVTPTDGNSSRKHSGNYEVASSYPSGGDNSKGTGKKVVFNDTVGYRVFNEDSLCAEDN